MKDSFSSPLTTDRLVGHLGCLGPPILAMIDIHPEVLLPLSQRKKPTRYPWEGKL
jgi:hypothetical protein